MMVALQMKGLYVDNVENIERLVTTIMYLDWVRQDIMHLQRRYLKTLQKGHAAVGTCTTHELPLCYILAAQHIPDVFRCIMMHNSSLDPVQCCQSKRQMILCDWVNNHKQLAVHFFKAFCAACH